MSAYDLLETRFAALQKQDYAGVYATYHADSPFLQQFADLDSYRQFARQQLATIQIEDWQSLRQRHVDGQRQEHLLVMKLSAAGQPQYFYELALLIQTPAGWRYHSAQKLGADDYAGPPEQIDFHHFDRVEPKIRF